MRILINGVAALRPKTGIGHYIESLSECFIKEHGDDRICLFPNALARRVVKRLFRSGAAHPTKSTAKPTRLKLFKASWKKSPIKWMQRAGSIVFRRAFRSAAARLNCDLYHEPNYVPWQCDLPVVATIHDLSVLLYPEWHPAERVKYFETHFFRGLQRCVHLIADSQCVRQEIIDKLGIPPERVTAVHLGVRSDFRPMPAAEVLPVLKGLDLQPGYFLHVGTIEPRKNLKTLMQAYCDLPARLREQDPLILVGGWGWKNEEIRDYYETVARFAGVRKLGYVPDDDLPALYNGARALVFPTRYEGFGFPPLEMMACGGAVISSTAGSVREIMPASQRALDPEDVPAWRDAMRALLEDENSWKLAKHGAIEHAGAFSWERCSRQTWDVYGRVLSGRSSLAA